MKIIKIFLLVICFLLITSCDKNNINKIDHIEIFKLPDKLEYYHYEEIATDGIIVHCVYEDETFNVIDDFEVCYSNLALGENEVTIKYQGFSTTYRVFIKEPCEIDIKIKSLPNKLEYFIDEEISFNGLKVEVLYDDGSSEEISNFDLSYDDLKIGKNTIYIKYHQFLENFDIFIKEVEKIRLFDYHDFSSRTIKNINFLNYDLKITDIEYGVYRATNKMIIYDEANFVNTNAYGYEISVDEYGYVCEVGTNVSLKHNGFVLSGHGTSAKVLKTLNVGDVVIYVENMVFIYQNSGLDYSNKIYIKFLDIVSLLSNIDDVYQYNEIVSKLNDCIPDLNNLYITEELDSLEGIYDYLDELSNEFNFDVFDYTHKYSYEEVDFSKLSNKNENATNYMLFTTYTEKLYYGGFRNADTIVYYDKSNLRTRNAYGYEVAVDENNIIVDMDILVELPVNGYILSGHSSGADFIKNNLSLGNKVEIKTDVINFYKDFGTSLYNDLVLLRNEAVERINYHYENSIAHDYIYINELVSRIDDYLRIFNGEIQNVYHMYKISIANREINRYIAIIYSQLVDYKVDTARGMWYYPFTYPGVYDDTTIEGIRNTLDRFKEMGFNEIIMIPFKGNYCLYDSNYFYMFDKLNEYNYDEYGHDYLKCFIEEAHKRDIVVNAFTQTFRCFEEGSKCLDESYYQVDYNGSLSRGQIYYYDICNDYVQEVLYNWYIELVSKYDFDKIEYDIIRYSASNLYRYFDVDVISDNTVINDPGYTEYSMNKFMELYGLDGDLKELIKTDVNVRKNWIKFKEDELISFITKTTSGIKNIKPNIVITAAVMSDFNQGKNTYNQDAKKWLELGIVDEIEPMAYSDVVEYVFDRIKYYDENLPEYEIRIGLSHELDLITLAKEVELSSNHGYILFNASVYLREQYYQVLKMNHHCEFISKLSTKEERINAIKLDLIDRIENYYEIKNLQEYDMLIELLKANKFDEFKNQLSNIDDQLMKDYLIDCINNI